MVPKIEAGKMRAHVLRVLIGTLLQRVASACTQICAWLSSENQRVVISLCQAATSVARPIPFPPTSACGFPTPDYLQLPLLTRILDLVYSGCVGC